MSIASLAQPAARVAGVRHRSGRPAVGRSWRMRRARLWPVRSAGWAVVARLLALALLAFATPGGGEVLRDVVAAVIDIDCQEGDGCGAGAGLSCPRACSHCSCCAHASPAPLAPALALLLPPAGAASARPWHSERRLPSGYRAPPFRPPAA